MWNWCKQSIDWVWSRATPKNTYDLLITRLVTTASVIMSVEGKIGATVGITSTSLFLSLMSDIYQVQSKAHALNEKQTLLEEKVTPLPILECSTQGVAKVGLIVADLASLGFYIPLALIESGASIIPLILACTIYHLGRKFIDSPVAEKTKQLDKKISSKIQGIRELNGQLSEKIVENDDLKKQIQILNQRHLTEIARKDEEIERLKARIPGEGKEEALKSNQTQASSQQSTSSLFFTQSLSTTAAGTINAPSSTPLTLSNRSS